MSNGGGAVLEFLPLQASISGPGGAAVWRGEVIEVNQALEDAPETVNSDPYAAGWMIKLRARDFEGERGALMDAAAYEKHAAEEESNH